MDAGTAKDYIDDLVQQVNYLTAQLEFWRTTALRAIENTDKALAIIELHKALNVERQKGIANG
jgi:hypothetical protein